MAWAKNGTPDTLGSGGGTIEITDLTAKKFNQFMCHALQAGDIDLRYRFNNLSTSIYAERFSINGAADSTNTSQTEAFINNTASFDVFSMIYEIGIATEEKLLIIFAVNGNTAGAANAPNRSEVVTKVANTTNTVDEIKIIDNSGTEFAANSNLSAIGSD